MLTTLRRIVLEFSQNAELDSALHRMVVQIKETMNTDCCSIYLADHHKQHFLLVASDGLAERSLGQTTIGFTEGLVGLVGQREEPLNIANAQHHPQFVHAPEVEEDELNAFLGTPIIHRRKVLGILSIQQKEARYFTENEEAFLVTLSAQLATSLANAEANFLITEQDTNSHWTKALQGVAGSSGVMIGEMFVVYPVVSLATVYLQRTKTPVLELQLFEEAVTKTRIDFDLMTSKLQGIIADSSLDIFDMYKQLLDNANIGKEVSDKIKLGWTAESALKQIIDGYVIQFEALDDSYFRERASDIRDLGNRLLLNLKNLNINEKAPPNEFILVAEEVTAAMLAQYQHQGLKGVVSLLGSNNSHAAILARALGVPAVMGIDKISLSRLHQKNCIVDGYSGELFVQPNEALQREYQHLIKQETRLADKVKKVEKLPAITKDGHAIELQLNAGLSSGFEHSKNSGAAGIGLYRTEIPFMNRSCFPSESEQTQLYRQVLSAFPNQPVTMRTLDVGGDKSLPYFPINEDNPFLGWRGIRITLDHPEIFLLQVRAMLRANVGQENLEIMLPMISSVVEVDEASRLINQAYYELSAELNFTSEKKLTRPKIGIMIEVPGIIYQLPELADKVDFFSVGSNDLTQYLLAVDRNNARVSGLYNSYHPAVLRALNHIAEQSTRSLVPLSLCGELASEPAGALLLLAMGYDKLSMNAHNIAKIKWVIRHVDFHQVKLMLAHVLTLSTSKKVHSYLNEQLELFGLGGFVRAGR
ncbi:MULTISPECIES: phosphoenolpyruvate--protein phosphotransferase [unclassified Colwellia]|uniref:phosphoenolpyruvate--protein phosphotransferase n=1 Tax=unclassified Colwellia TaxID=196834 RepID=UPI0015F5E429|nr:MULTISPECIES: phosphoenolpyruvate--protein phosphotransferase [unclassified Colwellia]MBA6230787.1 phosphoenolpyruvate--protein phosphotransferase [Colwellia sp. MB02u-7]MBA6234718.1 phosphoenolpyruvate--protein phosphotransferase [Colwellia sp. MB02u-11]MBA6255581.1 phosphoenolpyruvate--protein phosphotransferase [Colwellia sp. MB3u-28]MBA6261722.1 phosphoenolpyruvate--protein phosphotransferase [Colwellia sp. MB3u-41]MBA6301273.1 phosphoenolpyruvate--protein phosphotransferase [Colwellia 